MESRLPAFREKNPQLDVVTQLIRGQHPHLKGLYHKYLSLSLSLSLSYVKLNKNIFLPNVQGTKTKG